MASASAALGKVMDTVASTSDAVCNTINIVTKSATFGSNWMDAVLTRQSVTLKIDNEIFMATYLEQRAVELATQRQAIEDWADKNKRTKELYEQSLEQLKVALGK